MGEMLVEPNALRHEHERCASAPLHACAVVETKADAIDDMLDHRLDRDRELVHGAHGQPAAARLVPGEASFVEEQHARAPARETDRRHRARGPGTDHDDVEALHGFRIVRLRVCGRRRGYPVGRLGSLEPRELRGRRPHIPTGKRSGGGTMGAGGFEPP